MGKKLMDYASQQLWSQKEGRWREGRGVKSRLFFIATTSFAKRILRDICKIIYETMNSEIIIQK